MGRIGFNRQALLLSSAALAVVAASPAWAQTRAFNLPAQNAVTGVPAFARQAGVQILVPDSAVEGRRTAAVRGNFTREAGLSRLLAGTGLEIASDDGRTITLRRSEGPQGEGARGEPARSQPVQRVQELVVTGTLIRGSAPIGASVTTYTRQDIDKSGAQTLDQFARQITSNFSGADTVAGGNTNAGFGVFAQGAQTNAYAGAAFNLHGLGANSTLTLLNGHRLAGGGSDGSITDSSMIPLSAIERVEVLDDGASAIYGSDAVAGVVNIITRKDFDGAETRLQYGGATDGGGSNVTVSQMFGKSWAGGNALINYEYNDQGGLDASQRPYIGTLGGPYSLIPKNRRNSVFFSGNEDVGATTSISLTGLYSNRNFSSNYTVNVPFEVQEAPQSGNSTEYGATLAIDHDFGGGWRVNLSGNFSKINQDSLTPTSLDFPEFGFSEDISVLSKTAAATEGVDAILNGALFRAPGGEAKVALGASYRAESFSESLSEAVDQGAATVTGSSAHRGVTSAYGQLDLPLIGPDNAQAWARSLGFSVAGRYDGYSDVGSAYTYKLGSTWEIVQGFKLRGTYGTSFQAPLLANLSAPVSAFAALVADPRSPTAMTDLLTLSGGNANLRPETAHVASVGFDFKPAAAPGLVISTTYFNIDFANRIQIPPSTSSASVLAQPLLTSFINRNPSLAEVESYFSSPGFLNETGEGAGYVTALFDGRIANIAQTEESGVDIAGRYSSTTRYGEFVLSADASVLIRDQFKATADSPGFELLNTFGEPTSFKFRGGPGWNVGAFTSAISINYVNGYTNNLVTPVQHIAPWTTVDIYLSYRPNYAYPLLKGLKLAVTALNITDRRPPFALLPASAFAPGQKALPYDLTNASPMGRFVSVQITKAW